jgi:RNA polymerase sigma-70 factor (ECF subfamily)
VASARLGEDEEQRLLAAALGGDEGAFERLIAPYRGALQAHCYRMLGSVHDAEDALQDALLRVWRGLSGFEDRGGGALRAWLYRIATNASLDLIARRRRRGLPADLAPRSNPDEPPGKPLTEQVWIEPWGEEPAAAADEAPGPGERAERRETLELAFVAAMQQLPARQRAVLILREVLGFSAAEVGETLETSVPSVNSALQRARAAVDQRIGEPSQLANLRELGDARMREIVDDYMEAMGDGDVPRVVSMLTEDMAWSMPPLASWYGGRDGHLSEVESFLRNGPLNGSWRWRHRPARANGQLAVGTYTYVESAGAFLPFSLDVLTLAGDKIKAIDAFVVRTLDVPDGYARWPDFAPDPEQVRLVFTRCGLPDRLDP